MAGDAQRRLSLRLESPNSDSTLNFGSREGPAGTAPQLILLVQSPTPQVNYSPSILAEAAANNGSITQVMTLNLVNDTYVADVVSAGRVTAGNVPAGLTPVFTRLSDSRLLLGFTGAASAHGNANDVANLTVTFANGSFTLNPAAAVTDSTVTNWDQFQRPLRHLDGECRNRWQVAPSGAQSSYANEPVAITASGNAGYGFVNWTLTSGSATFASATIAATTVTPTSNATVTANFASLPSLALSGSASEGSESGGVITVNLSTPSLSARSIPPAGHSRIYPPESRWNHHADQRHQRDHHAGRKRGGLRASLLTSASASPPTNHRHLRAAGRQCVHRLLAGRAR